MIRHISAFLIILLSAFSANAQIRTLMEADNELKDKFLKYKNSGIVSETVLGFDIVDGQVSKESDINSKITIDEKNMTMTEEQFLPSSQKRVMIFNANDNIREVSVYYDKGGLSSRVLTFYDESGRQTGKEYYFGTNFTFRITNKYNSAGMIVKQSYEDSAGVTMNNSDIKYDSGGNISEEVKYDADGNVEIVYSYNYTGKSAMEESIKFQQSNYVSKNLFYFDEKGNKKEYQQIMPNGKVDNRSVYNYDNNGNLTEQTDYKEHVIPLSKFTYKYDDKGNRVEWKEEDIVNKMSFLYKSVFEFKK